MDSFDFAQARLFLKNKQERKQEKCHLRFEQAWADFECIIEALIEKHHPKRIYQWGSLLKEQNFSERSDIDIAVEGVRSPEEYFQMLKLVDSLTDFPVDLVELEKIHPLHAETIQSKGRLVYENNGSH